MIISRRSFLKTTAASGVTILPFMARAGAHSQHEFASTAGTFRVHPVAHASLALETPVGVIYCDPVGDPAAYADLPPPDLILVTHEHGDHFNGETLQALAGTNTPIITNPAVLGMLTGVLAAQSSAIGNGDSTDWNGVGIAAIPAYNTTADRLNFHPQGRDNGYVLALDGFRIYLSGDTEDIPEMRALTGINLAFVCMNLPFTMDAKAAASAVAEFRPSYVYPYHYRGRGDGTQDPAEFAQLVGDATEVKFGDWYG